MRSHFLRAAQKAAPVVNPFTLVASSTVGTATSDGTISATIPAGRQVGDLILVVHAARSTTDLNMSLADPTYTTIADLYANDSFDSNLGVHWKISNGTETTLALPGGGGFTLQTCSVQVWRGVDAVSPLDVPAVFAVGTNSGRAINPPISTLTAGCLIICAAANISSTGNNLVTPPSGFTDKTVAEQTGATTITRASMASAFSASAGAVEAGGWVTVGDSTSYSWCACTLALRPA